MYLLGKRADQISAEDVNRLIESQVQENISLDYKMDFDLSKDAEKKEFLYDIASMMNAQGGCLVFGLKERKDDKGQNTGIPEEVTGIVIDNEDKTKQQIEDIIKTSTDPQRSNIVIKFIEIEDKKILIIGVSKGLGFPTMVTYKGTNKFYKRRNTGKYPVDVHELNQMFMQSEDIVEKTTNFRLKRIRSIRSGGVFNDIEIHSSFFIHIFPFSHGDGKVLDLSIAPKMNLDSLMRPMNASGYFPSEFNVYGYCVASRPVAPHRKIFAYDQILRTGIYEAYTAEIFEKYDVHGRNPIYRMEGKEFIKTTLAKINDGLEVFKKFQIEPPFIIALSLHGMRGGVIKDGHEWSQTTFSDDEIMFAPQVLQSYEDNVYKLLKPTFDILWQSLGYSKSPDIEF